MRCFLDLIIHRFPHHAFFFIFFVRHFGPIKRKSSDCRLTSKVVTFILSTFFPWEEDEGLFIIIFGLLSCVSIVTRARPERTKEEEEEEEALTHLSTERERERERGATDDHHRDDCFWGARRALCYFFLEEGLRFSSSSIRSPPRKVWL